MRRAHEIQENLCAGNMFQDTCHKELLNVGITGVCNNISLRITSYNDDMNI